jgi:hypothetical protein
VSKPNVHTLRRRAAVDDTAPDHAPPPVPRWVLLTSIGMALTLAALTLLRHRFYLSGGWDLGYFLDDIDRPQWGLQVRDPHLGDRLWDVTCDVLDNAPAVAADIAEIRRKLAKVTAHNLSSLPEQLHPAQLIGQDETSE